ncbi:MAG: sigma-70 family RNA polymerase sigma factor [Phaeodactylibacter sp.]|nr:sigma-70 family RNA polymerase sigma factor [Phaeodactylibacter sp.]MCB9265632.1 sigma-70 family RNA polymerase sigma factor [Lewinellaceae bacterium]MCB9290894.1 sigma-70 family RNA polymerase sigma factor [Lewinellaceae bacterium]
MSREQEWLKELQAGKREAYEKVYRRHYRMVESLVLRMGGDGEDAQDIFQESLFALIQNIRKPGFQLNGKISTLLYAIARNIWLKKRASEKVKAGNAGGLAENLPQEGSPREAEEREALIRLVTKSLNDLEEDCREVLRYSFYQNLPQAEIARLMGYSEAFVKVKKFRCLEYLRRIVRDSQDRTE